MSQRTKSHPGASCAEDSTNNRSEGSEKTGAMNAQPRGFITSTMRPTMRPVRRSPARSTGSIVGAPVSTSSQPRGLIISIMSPTMRVGHGSQLRPTSEPNGVPVLASSQPRGFTTSDSGVHQCPTGSSTPCRSASSMRTIPHNSNSWPTPVGAADRLAEGSTFVLVVVDCDIRPGHRSNESAGSPTRAPSHSSAVALSPGHQSERERRTAIPEGSRSNAPSLGLHSLTEWWKSGSKMVEQVPCSRRRCRWPLSGPVPEVPSGSLRWAS